MRQRPPAKLERPPHVVPEAPLRKLIQKFRHHGQKVGVFVERELRLGANKRLGQRHSARLARFGVDRQADTLDDGLESRPSELDKLAQLRFNLQQRRAVDDNEVGLLERPGLVRLQLEVAADVFAYGAGYGLRLGGNLDVKTFAGQPVADAVGDADAEPRQHLGQLRPGDMSQAHGGAGRG